MCIRISQTTLRWIIAVSLVLFGLSLLARQASAQRIAMNYQGAYAGGTTYQKGDSVASGGATYVSLISNNSGNTPASNPSDWATIGASGGYPGVTSTGTGSIAATMVSITGTPTNPTDAATVSYVGAHGGGTAPGSINLLYAPYYASGSAATTTTNESTAAGATAVTLVSCQDLAANQGIFIGAGGGALATPTLTLTSGSAAFTVSLNHGIAVGQVITAPGVPSGSEVVSISGTSGVMSLVATANETSESSSFAQPYIGSIAGCSGGWVTVSPATSGVIPTGVLVQHDESAALQSAVNAFASTGGVIVMPSGTYNLNGPLQDTAHANAIINMPVVTYGKDPVNIPPVAITIQGVVRPTGGTLNGTIFQTLGVQGNLIGGYCTGCIATYNNFTNVWLALSNITFRSYQNPAITMVDALNLVGSDNEHLYFDTGYPGGFNSDQVPITPTNPNGQGLVLPLFLNNVAIAANDVTTYGYYNGIVSNEHAHLGSVYGLYDLNCFVFNGGGGANSASVDYLWGQDCTNNISAGTQPLALNIKVADFESSVTYDINDPNNFLSGIINFSIANTSWGSTQFPVVNGGSRLSLTSLKGGNSHVQIGGAINVAATTYMNPSLPSGQSIYSFWGTSLSQYNAGGIAYKVNTTPNLSTVQLALYGTNGLIINGLSNATLAGDLALTDSGTATTNILTSFEPSLATGNSTSYLIGKAASANNSGAVTYAPNATANLSTVGLGIYGNNGLKINGLGNATLAGDLALTDSGTGSTMILSALEPSLGSAFYTSFLLGRVASANQSGGVTFTSNNTANLSAMSIGMYGMPGFRVNALDNGALNGSLSLGGHLNMTGSTAPVASSCGGGTATGNDSSFQVTGITSATSCTVTFGSALQQGFCTANGAVNFVKVPAGASTTSIVFGLTSGETAVTAHCF